MDCYVCSVYTEDEDSESFQSFHSVQFLEKPYKATFSEETVCHQCYVDMKEGRLTDFGPPYGYRGKLMDDNTFYPHTRGSDGTLTRLEPIIEDYDDDFNEYFSHDEDAGQVECYRERVGGPLLYRRRRR